MYQDTSGELGLVSEEQLESAQWVKLPGSAVRRRLLRSWLGSVTGCVSSPVCEGE